MMSFFSLNPRYQKVLEMRYLEDLDFDKIANELNTTSQNIRKIVSRAISALKERLSEDKK
jgi:RNA polymerase sigma factor (sigma-70 family)